MIIRFYVFDREKKNVKLFYKKLDIKLRQNKPLIRLKIRDGLFVCSSYGRAQSYQINTKTHTNCFQQTFESAVSFFTRLNVYIRAIVFETKIITRVIKLPLNRSDDGRYRVMVEKRVLVERKKRLHTKKLLNVSIENINEQS